MDDKDIGCGDLKCDKLTLVGSVQDSSKSALSDGLGVKPTQEITLNIKQIIELAEFAGLPIDKDKLDKDGLDTPVVITECPALSWEDEPDVRYGHMAYFEEYPDEGQMPLGDKINA